MRILIPIFIVLLLVAAVLRFLIYNQPQPNKFEAHSVEPHLVLDCNGSNNSNGPDIDECVERVLEYTVTDCERWTVGQAGEPACAQTTEGLNDISYIADPANYVPFPFTKMEYAVEMIPVELQNPWDLAFLPDGSMLVTEKVSGTIKLIKEGSGSTVHTADIYHEKQTGLLGLAVDPNFTSNQYVYVYFTDKLLDKESERVSNKLVRLVLINGKLENETVLLANIPGSLHHSGGRLAFGPDDKLYLTTGDAQVDSFPQDITSLAGKILRMNSDGSIPNDNPFKKSYTYSYGHRNPQGLTWNTKTGDMYESEHGPWRHDEINPIFPGQNYGWPDYKCDEVEEDVISEIMLPIFCTKSWTMAPSGIEYVSDPASPWDGSLFIAMLRGKQIHRLVLKNNKVVESEIFYVSKDPEKDGISKRIRDVEYYNGSLYAIGERFGMIKITPL